MRAQPTRIVVAVTACALLASCALVDPIVVRGIGECDPTVSGSSGKQCAGKLRNAYLTAVSDRERLNTATNAGLLTLITTFGMLAGLDKINTQTMLAGGIGGAALLATPRVFGSEQRDFIYLAGAEAMNCVLDGAGPALDLAGDEAFTGDVEQQRQDLLRSVEALEAIDSSLPAIAVTEIGQDVKNTLAEASALYLTSGRTLRALRRTDSRVMNAARSIDTKVNVALVRERTDPVELAQSLGASTTLVQGFIQQVAGAGAAPAALSGDVEETSGEDVRELVAAAKARILALTALHDEMKEALSPFDSDSLRRRCTIDAPDIKPFATDTGRIDLPAPTGDAVRAAVVEVQGGKAPHRASLVGVLPPDPNTLVLSMEDSRDGFARVRITATPALPAGTYTMKVADNADRRATVRITAAGSGQPSRATGAARAPAPEFTALPAVESLQKKLTSLAGCTPKDGLPSVVTRVLEAANPGAADGKLGADGSKTRDAIGNALSMTVTGEDAPPKQWNDLEGDIPSRAAAVEKRVDTLIGEFCKSS